jgi:hypothetical protein
LKNLALLDANSQTNPLIQHDPKFHTDRQEGQEGGRHKTDPLVPIGGVWVSQVSAHVDSCDLTMQGSLGPDGEVSATDIPLSAKAWVPEG